uniref:PR domain zinc finger protein 15 n=1 Tax=Ceratitis capitata TaxID=7213 RepID=W8AMB6_CERCA
MADFDIKFKEMQKYLPFLQNVIEKLRSSSEQNDDNPRKAQLKKMEVLYDLLKSNGKKLKMETLLKCEGLLIKLHSKMERSENDTSKPTNQTSNLNNTTKTMSNNEVPSKTKVNETSVEIVDITGPESPPPQPLEEVPPVEIPIERRGSPVDEIKSRNSEQRDKHKHSSKHERHQHQHQYNHHHHPHPHPHQSTQQQPHNKMHYERHQSQHNSRERHQQQNINQNRPGDRSRDQSHDSLNVFMMRNVSMSNTNDDKQPVNRDPRASQADIYSPEESWDDIESSQPSSSNSNRATISASPASPPTIEDRTFHDTIFNFKKKLTKSNEMFSRVRTPAQPATPTNRAAPPISIPVKVPTIPDVLKSPPLSASDISDLLNDTDSGKSVPSISEIGTRRSVKSTTNNTPGPISPAEAASLDKARKKFAIVTQNSPQLRGSPDALKSPLTSTPKDLRPSSSSPLPKERIALKYNPHPRTERNVKPHNSNSNNTQPTQIADPRLNLNRLNSITNKPTVPSTVPQDPRLRKVTPTTVSPSWNQQPKTELQKPVPTTASKSSVKTSHIPSLLEVKVIDPRTLQNAGFSNTPMVSAQQMLNKMPTNQSQVGIFSRRNYPAKVAVPPAYGGVPAPPAPPPPTVQRSKSGYSSEENWDSEPDEPVAPKVIQQAAQSSFARPFLDTATRKDTPLETSFRPTKPPLLPTPKFGRPNSGMGIPPTHVKAPHFQQMPKSAPQNPNHCKFSAVLNDKTERSKYFESKKQKKSEPRTYMEYKQAKARAAAEEAARKAAEEKAKGTAETSKDIGEVSDVDNSVLAKLAEHPPVTSTLDKLYRSTDFSGCEFPKAKTSFKIPRKVTEKAVEENEPAPKAVTADDVEKTENAKINKNEELLEEKSQKDLKKPATMDKNKTLDKQLPNENEKKKNDDKVQVPKKAQELTTEKKETTKSINKDSAKKECQETNNKKSSDNEKKKILNKTQAGNKRSVPVKTKAGKELETEHKPTQNKPATVASTIDMNPTLDSEANSAPSTAAASVTVETEKTAATPAGVEAKPVVEAQAAVAADAKDKASVESVVQKSVTICAAETDNNEAKESEKEATTKSDFLKELANIGRPARILKRRNTMMVRGSLPEIDRELFPKQSLVYEDIQGAKEAERRKQLDAQLPKMNKCLAEIFQKTDDNCKVSTQNIITGKRRTRTNVNFNEVQRSLEIFQRKRRSKPLKQPAEKPSPSTSKATPKGRKAAEGKLAKNETSSDNVSEQATSEVVTEQVPVVKIEKVTKRKRGRKIKSEPGAEEVETTKEAIDKDEENTATEKKTNDTDATEPANVTTAPTGTAVAATAAVKEKSPKPGAKSDALTDDDAQKRQLLESFVQDILNPKKDKAQIFSLLSLILSEDNLKIVKEIVENTVEKNAKQTEETNDETIENESVTSANADTSKMNTSDEKSEGETLPNVIATTPRTGRGKKKKNELDRLNEDIRTMFISQGVLTATGRRMCTLVAAAEQANNTNTNSGSDAQLVQTAAAEPVEVKTTLSNAEAQKATPALLPRIRKSKVVLEPINIREFQKPFEPNDEVCDSDVNNDEVKSEMSPTRKMPILKPHTPIKQSEVEDDSIDELAEASKPKNIKLDIKVKRSKPGPKCSKKHQIDTVSSDDDAVDDEPNVDLKPTTSVATVKEPDVLKNTNKEWHSQSKWVRWCVLCDKKISSSTHYVRYHGEFYASRLTPDILEKLKEGKISKPYFGVLQKKMVYWSYRCPFCLQLNRTTQPSWVEHLITHTGEYNFQCSNCHRPSSKGHQLENHIKKECNGATAVRKHTIPTGPVLRAHVCHLCDFIQLTRQGIDMHLMKQHGIPILKAAKLGYTIDLLDTRDVEMVDCVKALEWEMRIKNEGLESIVMASNENTDSSLVDVTKQGNNISTTAGANDESMDSDDLPIAKTAVQLTPSTKAQKAALEKASNSNIFVPTRDTNDSPTMNNFAQSLFTSEQPEIAISSAGTTGSTGVVSIAERLCQKFKNIQKSKNNMPSEVPAIVESTKATAPLVVEHEVEAVKTASNEINQNTMGVVVPGSATVTDLLNTSTETARFTNADDSTSTMSLTQESATSKTVRAHTNSSAEDDDDDWEDIEVTESAPVKAIAANSTAPNSNNKNSKTKTKNVLHKLNRLYATNNKLKKSLSITIGNRKKEERKECSGNKRVSKEKVDKPAVASSATTASVSATASDTEPTAVTSVVNIPPINSVAPTATVDTLPTVAVSGLIEAPPLVLLQPTATTSPAIAATSPARFTVALPAALTEPAPTSVSAPTLIPTADFEQEIMPLAAALPECVAPNLGFRPLITNLDDLLPDSPCNDPIELVPELTPMESLQDLCDVSSILNSDYMSDNWVSNITPIDLNNDSSQQANMQEALDFVKEQQSVQNSIVTSNSSTLVIPSIQRLQNIGYSKSADDNTYKFYCLSKNCTFLYSSEVIGLDTHFRIEHAENTWDGYCHTCKAKVDGKDDIVETKLPLSAELNHMRSKHLATISATTLPVFDELKQPSKSNSPALDEDRPRIKIRRLTGDCLSSTPTPTSAQNTKSVPIFDENAQLVGLAHVEPCTVPTVATSFLNKISASVEQPIENRHFENIGTKEPFTTVPNAVTSTQTSTITTTPCQLQIASVVSLQDQNNPQAVTPAVPLPVISNVCSLNARSVSSPISNTGALWAQHIAEERAELESSAADSLEVSRILSNASKTATPLRSKDVAATKASVSESPEPEVVAETVARAKATSGNFLITQTMSAQYEEGRLGFNISIANNPTARLSRSDSSSSASTSSAALSTVPQFKCMANGCKYQTRLPVAMGDHLRFHDRQNFSAQREYLRCSLCSYLAKDLDDLIQHTDKEHGLLMGNDPDIDAIRDILRSTDSNGSSVGNNVGEETVLSFTPETWETALKELVTPTGVPDAKLFRCTIEDCKTKLTEASYYSHVVYHLSTLGHTNVNTHVYKCPHCKSSFNKPQKIKAHIKTHGIHKYFCYVCTVTTVNLDQMYKHYEQHWRGKKLRNTALPTKAIDKKNWNFHVVHTTVLTKYEIDQFREKLVDKWKNKKSSLRTHFKPSEITLLPLTPIFAKDLNCAVCPYKTKVRTNLMRHLQMHTDDNNGGGIQHVANVDPINPVPCLNSSEKHFDKMTNLASSSLVVASTSANATNTANGGSNTNGKGGKLPYDYVPDTKRYTCGVNNCQYLTISDDIFRHHLNALHSDISFYNCPHCKEEICKRNLSIERVLNHLRFHGPKLYQCEMCGYLHYMKTVVERHTRQHDVQPPQTVKVTEYDRTKDNAAKQIDNITAPTSSAQSIAKPTDTQKLKTKQKWACNLCGHKAMTQQQIIAHALSQHSCKNQYQCMHCTFNAAQLVQIMTHIDEKHAGKKREARYVYTKIEGADDSSTPLNEIDTRPLWMRDDPKRIRHIRGILMEDEEESERYRKRLRLDDNDDGVEENSEGDENVNLNLFGFLCYYCNAQFTSHEELREQHWQSGACTKFDVKKPFRFRICTQLKCPQCLSFVGNSLQLLAHMKELHKFTSYMAADPNATAAGLTCGHCVYRGPTLRHLMQHSSRVHHKPLDLKSITLPQLEKLKSLGAPLSYVQCLSCMELFANRACFYDHAQQRTNECTTKMQEISNKLIYACSFCPYKSQQEMAVLRHMIDHYSGFKRCCFCKEPQTTFNGYMQHCYSDHREQIKNFCSIYTIVDISKFLQQLLLIFPNGLTLDLYNLRLTPSLREYGNKHIKLLYDEIQKTSQQPPIPRLSLGRLVALKFNEEKMSASNGVENAMTTTTATTACKQAASASTAAALQLAGNSVKPLTQTSAPQRIMKRRITIAMGRDDSPMARFSMDAASSDLFNGKKRKTLRHNFDQLPPPPPRLAPLGISTATQNVNVNPPALVDNMTDSEPLSVSDNEVTSELKVPPFSYYGQTPVPIDLSKVFIKIAAGDAVETRVNISKFKLLYNITPRVLVTPTDMTNYRKTAAVKRKTIKPCPASHKIRYS